VNDVRRPTPLTLARVEAYLRSADYHVATDEDGDITGIWNGHRFWFTVLGEHNEVLHVRGRWESTVPLPMRSAALLALNDWNRDRIWPKAYLREEDDGLAVYGETSVDLEHGVNDKQLERLVDCGLGTTVHMFTTLSELLELPSTPTPPDP
jgi:hypothetical protein